jgi:lipoprotein-releasing system permease protein
MNFRLETFIAYRYLSSRRDESFISISSLFSFIGIMIGVATLIVVMSVMNGFRTELVDKIVGINGHIILYFNNDAKDKYIDITESIEKIENVELVSKELEMHAMLSSEDNSSGVLVKGIDKLDLYERESISNNIIKGSLDSFEGNNIILGTRLAAFLRVKLNDKISLITSSKTTTPFGSIPNIADFKVIGIFDVGMYNYDRNIAFIPRETSSNLLNKELGYLSQLEIFLNDKSKIDITTKKVLVALEGRGNVYKWNTLHKELFNALEVEKKVMFLILSLIIFVAAFNLISSIIMIVKDKERGIGILRSIGLSKGQVLRIFIIIGSFVGLIGTFIGLLLGLLISNNIGSIQLFLEDLFNRSLFSAEIYFFNIIPSNVNVSEVLTIVLISLILSLLSTVYPAWKASKIEPANILRYD